MSTLTPSQTLSDHPIFSPTCPMDHLMISQYRGKSADTTYTPKCTSCAIICFSFWPRLMSSVGPEQNIQEVLIMSRVEELQMAIVSLAPEEYARLRQWFAERDWEQWDRQIEEDAQVGKLDFLIEEAMAEKAQGRLR